MSHRKTDDVCAEPVSSAPLTTRPASPPIHLSAVYGCESPEQAEQLLRGEVDGYVYQRDGHPNSDQLAEKCRQLHNAERAMVFASGMSAMAAVLLARVRQGEHVVISDRLYGKTTFLLGTEATRLGIEVTVVDVLDTAAVRESLRSNTKLLVVETISNPTLRVAELAGLATICDELDVELLVDNTFATPLVCQPHAFGAHWVLESMSKMMNGHSDVMMGLLTGRAAAWDRVPTVASAWGLASAPFESWLALRGLATMHLRVSRACETALQVARFLADQSAVAGVEYPGLNSHPDHRVATAQFDNAFGTMVTFHLADDSVEGVRRFIAACERIDFCPSLGDIATTLSHPRSTSHRLESDEACRRLGISAGTIRLSVGVESTEFVIDQLQSALATF